MTLDRFQYVTDTTFRLMDYLAENTNGQSSYIFLEELAKEWGVEVEDLEDAIDARAMYIAFLRRHGVSLRYIGRRIGFSPEIGGRGDFVQKVISRGEALILDARR